MANIIVAKGSIVLPQPVRVGTDTMRYVMHEQRVVLDLTPKQNHAFRRFVKSLVRQLTQELSATRKLALEHEQDARAQETAMNVLARELRDTKDRCDATLRARGNPHMEKAAHDTNLIEANHAAA